MGIVMNLCLHTESVTDGLSASTVALNAPIIMIFPVQPEVYTCGFVLTCMQTEEFEMHASTKIIVVTGLTTELHAGRQRVHFSILQPFLLTTYGNNRGLEDIVSDK